MNLNNFQDWLRKRGLQEKSARDVVSRFKRAQQFIGNDQSANVEASIFAMTQNDEYKKLSLFVRSQLKRAVRLHSEYINEWNAQHTRKFL